MPKTISQLPAAASAAANAVVAADNAGGTLTEKVTLQQIAALAKTPATSTVLGEVIVPSSGGLAVDGSGNVSAAFASVTQAQAGLSASVVMNPNVAANQISAWKHIDFGQFGASVAGSGGHVLTGGIANNLTTGSTPNSSALLRPGNEFYAAYGYADSPGAFSGSNFWTRPQWLAFRATMGLNTANAIFRVQFGKSQGTTTAGRMTNPGIGVEVVFVNSSTMRVWLLAHNGTSLTATDTGINIRNTSTYEFVLSSNGGGVVSVSINGGLYSGTATGGPTTGGTSGLTIELINGTDASGSSAWVYRYSSGTLLS